MPAEGRIGALGDGIGGGSSGGGGDGSSGKDGVKMEGSMEAASAVVGHGEAATAARW